MSNIDIFSNGIKQIYEIRGMEAFENARLFHALLDDILPTLTNERKIFRSVIDDSLLKELSFMFNEDKSNKQFEAIRLKKKIEDNNGLSEKWSLFIIESFNYASGSDLKLNFAETESANEKNILVLPNGCKYEGDLVRGKLHGKGKVIFPDGGEYVGDFVDGHRTGKGKLTFPDGRAYVGEFIKGYYQGYGKFIWPNGDVYEGDFVNGKRTGKGKMTWIDGDVYEGDFFNDFRTGKARYTMANGEKYEGDFVEAKPHGKGKFVWTNGDTYEGDFVNGKITGNGTMIKNGIVQKDYFEDGILKITQENKSKPSNELESHINKNKKSLNARKDALTKELKSLGAFDIKKKIELKKQIQDIEKEMSLDAYDILLREWEGSDNNTDNQIRIMEVEDRFSIAGRGTVLVGKLLNERLNTGDTIIVNEKSYMVTAIEMNRKMLKYAESGDKVSILVRELDRRDVEKGDYVYIEN